jgi:hypothetical protein
MRFTCESVDPSVCQSPPVSEIEIPLAVSGLWAPASSLWRVVFVPRVVYLWSGYGLWSLVHIVYCLGLLVCTCCLHICRLRIVACRPA